MGLIRAECVRYLGETDIRVIEEDIRRLKREIPNASPRAQASKQQNVEILERRLERLGQIRDYVEVVTSQQKAIADAFRLLNDQILTLGFTAEEEAGLISSEIDRLITNVGETEEAIKKISVDMTSVRKVLGELSSAASSG
jgi:methyl-accepting chemotaxis protein